MKIIPVVGIILIAVGLGLILYSDPIVSVATGGGPSGPGGSHPFSSNNTRGTGGPVIYNGTSQGAGGGPGGGLGTAELLTVAGIGLCGAGLLVSAVDSLSGPNVRRQSETVA